MAQIEIGSFFTNNGVPATGISSVTPGYPKIRIWEVIGNTYNLVVGDIYGTGLNVDGVMIEVTVGSPQISDGFYVFVFDDTIGFDPTKKYLIRSDGGPSLTDNERYQSAIYDPIEETIINGVWNEPLVPDHQLPNSAGLTLSQIKADTTQLFLDLSSVRDLINLLLKYETNRTRIDPVNKTLTVYDDDCTTVLRVFELLDENGNLSTDSVCERRPIISNDGKPTC